MNAAYLDCFSGISGDMLLGALVDAGLPIAELEQLTALLHLEGCRLEWAREARSGIFGTRIMVHIDQAKQHTRNFADIRELISRSDLPENVKDTSISVFSSLAKVEAHIHNSSPEAVHFHEVGAVDSIVDIVGSVYGLFLLGVDAVHVSPLPLGTGFVQTAHGTMPVPAPATMALLRNVPVSQTEIPHELVTPTGAALVKTLAQAFGPIPRMKVEKIGYGVGGREFPHRPNLLRILLGKQGGGEKHETIVVLESNIDDMNPEWAGYLMERLFEEGALDVIFFPIQMKKNRPGIQVQVLARPDARERLTGILFHESGTLGVRFSYTERHIIEREEVEVESPWGALKAKKIIHDANTVYLVPEYESCRKVARRYGLPLRQIYAWVLGLTRENSRRVSVSSQMKKADRNNSTGAPRT